MAEKYLRYNNGMIEEVEATTVSTGASEAGKIVALDPSGHLDPSLLPPGIGEAVKVVAAYEDLSAGDIVNFFVDADGVMKIRKADASDPSKRAHGFVRQSCTAGEQVRVYLEGVNDQLSGLVPGAIYFLSDAQPGKVTDTPPTTPGYIVQEVGWATDTNELSFEPGIPIKLA